MMSEVDPPSYQFASNDAYHSTLTSINLGFVPDEGMVERRKDAVVPTLEPDILTSSQQMQMINFLPLTVEEIKRACHFYVTERCCYGSAFIENMDVLEVSDRVAYHYTLESFGEKRESDKRTVPFYGGDVDSAEFGPAPRPWDIDVTPAENFKNEKRVVEIPHTSFLKMCTRCNGAGNGSCKWCMGVGGKGCLLCLSSEQYRPCTSCKYSNRRCYFCEGTGIEKCKPCDGNGKLRTCNILIVTWTRHTDDFVTDTMNLPAEEVRGARGRPVFSEEAEELFPSWSVPNSSVIAASTDLLDRHRTGFENEAIRRQRHTYRAIPYTHVKYRWREDIGEFYVYGLDKKAYFETYPQEYCCCCTIM